LLTLTESSESEFVDFQVYNRGPLVLEENRQKLFQLGYSTRNTQEQHGKGLGLFFVNEIVKGYEGLLTLDNVQNQSDSYSIRIALKGGSVETNIVNVEVVDQRAVIIGDQGTSIRWQYSEAIESVEISSNSMQQTARFISMENDNTEDDSTESDRTEDRNAGSEKIGVYKKSESYLQPQKLVSNQLIPPCWSLDIQAKRGGNKTHNVIFNILDITGVRFSIKLPTAQARVDGIEPSWNRDAIAD
jgi:signal transduction histidine kinase